VKIVCAQSVLRGREAFRTLGDVTVIPDSEISALDLKNAEALITRSKTVIDATLTANTALRFAGTATAGFDHIDAIALDTAGIAWTAAPGCNAVSVAEYLIAALLELGERNNFSLEGKSLGIVGVGAVGSRVAVRAKALGMRVMLNDPPRAILESSDEFMELDDLLPNADIITLHTPLTDESGFATRKMVDEIFFSKLKPGCIFVNASRGEVVDEAALLNAMDARIVTQTVLDVWEDEPFCNSELLRRVDIATPHIAGYSFDGKLRGTAMVHESFCKFMKLPTSWNSAPFLPPSPAPEQTVLPNSGSYEDVLRTLIRRIYKIAEDDRALRRQEIMPNLKEHAKLFQSLRKNYPVRREFSGTTVHLEKPDPLLTPKIAALGFRQKN